MMSTLPSPADSPVHVEPLHNPEHAAQIVLPQAPLGNATNGNNGKFSQVPGMGSKALLAKKMAKVTNPKYVSPTDNLMTPCTQKISLAKRKHFHKGGQSLGQLDFKSQTVTEEGASSSEEHDENREPEDTPKVPAPPSMLVDDDENPF